jgi:hypothetical protein
MRHVGVYGSVASVAPSVAVKSPEMGHTASEGVWGHRGWLELVKRDRQTHWQDSGRENGTKGVRMVEEGTPGRLGNSSEESRSRGGGIGRAKARASSGEVRETLWAKARARYGAESTGHRVGAAKLRRGRIS